MFTLSEGLLYCASLIQRDDNAIYVLLEDVMNIGYTAGVKRYDIFSIIISLLSAFGLG